MSEDLIDWLHAQIDLDQQKAAAFSAGTWVRRGQRDVYSLDGDAVAAGADRAEADFIADHDPARVLREVEAKRKVIELYEYAVAAWLLDRDKPNPPTVHLGEKAMAEAVLQALALPYSDRPGYREEWHVG